MIFIDSIINCCKGCWNLAKTGSYSNTESKNLLKEEIVEVHFNQIYRDIN
jgi:hypothetical protein